MIAPALAGRTVLIVGGARDLGLAIARRITELGARVVIAARDADRAAEAAASLPGARSLRIDLTDEDSIRDAAASLGAVDHLVVTASAPHSVAVSELDRDRVVEAFDAKVIGPLLLAKHFAPKMTSGSFLFFSGVAAWNPTPGRAVMGITNGAVAFLARHLAAELAPVRVNAIAPGIIDSGTWDRLGDSRSEFFENAAGQTLAGRIGRPDDILDTVAWLLGAGYVSGETIHVDGGVRRS